VHGRRAIQVAPEGPCGAQSPASTMVLGVVRRPFSSIFVTV